MTRKEALNILGLASGATQEDIKKAYRQHAFSLHPDLNPDNPDASTAFRNLNEAYVFLTTPENGARSAAEAVRARGRRAGSAQSQSSEKTRSDAFSAYEKAKQRFREATGSKPASEARQEASASQSRPLDRDEVLRDILRDPFARRVFEDIYSQIRQDAKRKSPSSAQRSAKTDAPPGTAGKHRAMPPRQAPMKDGDPGVLGKTADTVSAWIRRQIDEEQTVRFAGELVPGKRIRLQIEHGLFGKSQAVELTLPPGFTPGKPIRLKGMGKRIGKWKGDLYLKIEGSDPE